MTTSHQHTCTDSARATRNSTTPQASPAPVLTNRMRQILHQLLDGRSEKEVAQALGISPHTVHIHVTRMYSRLRVTSRAELFALAYRGGLMHDLLGAGPGDGARETLSLRPLPVPALHHVNDVANDKAHGGGGGDGGGRAPTTVLFVEDHNDTRTVISRLLTRAGFDVITAGCYHEALETARSVRVNVLVADIGLPDGNGLALLAEMRRMYPVGGVVLSGYGMSDDKSDAVAAGFTRFLTKPIDPEQLTGAIRDVLREQASSACGAHATQRLHESPDHVYRA